MSIKDNVEDNFEQWFDKLAVERDELKLQIHLAGMEVRDEWEKMEKKWQHLTAKSKQVKEQVGESSKEIGSALVLLGEEIKQGYKNIKKSL